MRRVPCLVPGRGGSLTQLCLGTLQVLDAGALSGHPVTHSAGVVGVSAPEHLSHESAAWNLTVGVGFLLAAARRGVAEGLVPLLTAFVTILSLLSINDVARGEVSAARVLSHAFLIVGYLVILADPPDDRSSAATSGQGGPWSVGPVRDSQRRGLTEGSARPRLRLVTRPTNRLRRDRDRAA